jgi:hypothetical protein
MLIVPNQVRNSSMRHPLPLSGLSGLASAFIVTHTHSYFFHIK